MRAIRIDLMTDENDIFEHYEYVRWFQSVYKLKAVKYVGITPLDVDELKKQINEEWEFEEGVRNSV